MIPSIRFHEVTKRFQKAGVPAVDRLSLEIAPGTLFGYAGPNGAGKTTTIQLLVGALDASAGTIDVGDRRVTPDAADVKRRIGYVPAEEQLFDHLSANEHLSLTALAYGIDRGTAQARAKELLEVLDLAPDAAKPVREYSHGMKRKTALACALVHDPDLLVLDEPLEGIDAVHARTLKEMFVRIAATGRTVFLTSHNLALLDGICERIAIIDAGKLIFDGTPEALRTRAGVDAGRSLEDAFIRMVRPSGGRADLSWVDALSRRAQ